MKILITGGAGFIGSNLADYLVNEIKAEVLVLDKLTYAGNLSSLASCKDKSNYSFRKGDICDKVFLQGLFTDFKPDAVMHLAAESHVDRSIDGPEDFIETNILGTFRLLTAALNYYKQLSEPDQTSFRFLHVSTDEVYGSLGLGDPAFTEETAYAPHSPYSASKASSDMLVRAWADTYGLPILITNCSNNYGPYQFPEKLIPVVILKALSLQDIPVYGKGENIRDWLYVRDHAAALYDVLLKGNLGETYNIGGKNEKRNIDLVNDICEILDRLMPRQDNTSYGEQIVFTTDRPGHDLRYAIDNTKISQKINWEPEENVTSGFEKTVRWYLENRDWWEPILEGKYDLSRLGKL